MAIVMVIPNCVQVRLLWNLAGQLGVNVLNGVAQASVVVNQALADTLGAAIKTQFTNQIATHMGTNVQLVRIGVRDLRSPNRPEFLDAGALVAGTGTGDTMPGSVCALVTLRTAQAGKSFRGRVYLSGFVEADNTATGTTLASANTAAVAFVQAVSNAMGTSQMPLGVASRPAERSVIAKTTYHNDGTNTVRVLSETVLKTGVITPVTLFQARDAQWQTQRRRQDNRGALPTALTAQITMGLDGQIIQSA